MVSFERRSIVRCRFSSTKPIGKYIADFYSHDVLLVIEVDGGNHYSVDAMFKDAKKTEHIENIGITVLRFTDEEVLEKTTSVLQTIQDYIDEFRLKNSRE
ncbi:MAG: DUF559 domain-containing protein [Bacteroidota bacterium]